MSHLRITIMIEPLHQSSLVQYLINLELPAKLLPFKCQSPEALSICILHTFSILFSPFPLFFFLLSLLFPKCLRLLKTADFLKYLLSNEQANKSYMGLEGGFPPFHGVQVKQLLKTLVEELCLSVEPSAGGALLTRGRQRDLLCTGEALSFA